VVLVDDQGDPPASADQPAISQQRRNELNKALHFMLAKMRCRGHAFSRFLDEPEPLIPAQVSHSLGLSYTTRLRMNVTTTLEVDNLTDAKLYDYFGVQRPGRSFALKVTGNLR